MRILSVPARHALALAAFLTLAASLPGHADQSDRIVFDITLRGIRAGELAINGKISGDGYGANGVVQTTGFVGLLRKLRYDATVTGHFTENRFTPTRFSQTSDTPRGTSEQEIIYKNGTPVSVSRVPPKPPRDSAVDPKAQGGTIDPLTALYAVLRDVPRDAVCQLDVKMYDGAKRSQVRLFDPRPEGKDGIACSGEYRRLAGFSDEDMAKKTRFPFTLHYVPSGDGAMQVDQIETDTIFGKGRLERQPDRP